MKMKTDEERGDIENQQSHDDNSSSSKKDNLDRSLCAIMWLLFFCLITLVIIPAIIVIKHQEKKSTVGKVLFAGGITCWVLLIPFYVLSQCVSKRERLKRCKIELDKVLNREPIRKPITELDIPIPIPSSSSTSHVSQIRRVAPVSSMGTVSVPLPPLKKFTAKEAMTLEATTSDGRGKTTVSLTACAICLEELYDGEMVQPFPRCKHEFHPGCIHSWLQSEKTTCPKCRLCLRELLMNA